jgi:hypothetical protein
VRRVIDGVRQFLAKMGVAGVDATDAEVSAMLREAQRYLREKGRASITGMENAKIIGEKGENGLTFASKARIMRAPPQLTQWGFESDYKSAPGTPGAPLHYDIEGRRISGEIVVGRQSVGGPDRGIGGGKAGNIAEKLQTPVRKVPAKDISGDYGRFETVRSRRSGEVISREILLAEELSEETGEHVLQHEVGHLLDDFFKTEVGGIGIDTAGMKKELKQIYHDLNKRPGWYKKGDYYTPEADGYTGKRVDREYIAEAIRAYLHNPNYIKTVAPKVAARLRALVNTHPILSKVVTLNSRPPVGPRRRSPLAAARGAAPAQPAHDNS